MGEMQALFYYKPTSNNAKRYAVMGETQALFYSNPTSNHANSHAVVGETQALFYSNPTSNHTKRYAVMGKMRALPTPYICSKRMVRLSHTPTLMCPYNVLNILV